MLPWRCSGRHSNSRGEETTQEGQACAASLHPTDSPEDHVQLLTKSTGTSQGTDPKPPDTESMCSSQEGHKRGQQIKVYIWASFSLPFSFLRFDLIEHCLTIKIIFRVVKSTSTQSHFVIPHQGFCAQALSLETEKSGLGFSGPHKMESVNVSTRRKPMKRGKSHNW